MPSTAPVVEKAQHEPHWPWFLIAVTAPYFYQSFESGISFKETPSTFSPVYKLVGMERPVYI